MRRFGRLVVAAALWWLAAGCESGHEPPIATSLIALAESQGGAPILVRTTEKTEPVVFRSALPLDDNLGPGRRGLVTPVFVPPAGAELRFSYHAPDPVLRAAPIRLRATVRDETGASLATRGWTVRRHVLKESWRNARARRPMRSEAAENLRHLTWNLSTFSDRAISLEFDVEAEHPTSESVEIFERALRDVMPTPFAIIDPRIVDRGAPPASTIGAWWLLHEVADGAAIVAPSDWPAPQPVIAPSGHAGGALKALFNAPGAESAGKPRSFPTEVARGGGYAALLRLGGILPDRAALAGFNTVQFFADDENGVGGLTAFLRRLSEAPPSGPVFVAVEFAASVDPAHRDRVLSVLNAAPRLWRLGAVAGLPTAAQRDTAPRVPVVPLTWKTDADPNVEIVPFASLSQVRDRTSSVLGLAPNYEPDPGGADSPSPAPVFFTDPGATGVVMGGQAVTVFDAPHATVNGERAFVLTQDIAGGGPVAAVDPRDNLSAWLDALAEFRRGERAAIATKAPAPPRERVWIRLFAADRPTRFQGTIRCADFESASTIDPADAESLVLSRGGRALYFDFQLDSSAQAVFGFSSWPPGLEFETEFYANGDLLPDERVRFGGSDLPLFGNPGRIDPRRVWEYVASTPPIDASGGEARVQVWVAPDAMSGGEPFTELGAWASSWLNDNAGF